MAMMRAIGLMSGTSLDGVDIALIETDGERVHVVKGHNNFLEPLGPTGYRGYTDDEKALLRAATKDAESVLHPGDRPGRLPEAEAFVTWPMPRPWSASWRSTACQRPRST